jgi:hypothetical protein
VVEAVIDGVAIDANVTAGETYSQVATDLYTAMINAGITDAVLSGNSISFLTNTSGQEALDVDLHFTSQSQGIIPASWIEPDVLIAQRNIIT